ncbi:MAG: glycoside hydrolase family 32 protein [Bacteroidota bacterium]
MIIKSLHYFILLLLLFSCAPDNTKTETHSRKSDYTEKHRPQLHFSPETMWMNDPNGMVYYEGEYHLFYQYHPESTVWGPMHWGHAVSEDLVHWEHLPVALYPDSLGLIFSGSAVVDWKNTSNFGSIDKPPLVAIFTHHLMEGEKAERDDFQYQSIAYSNDKGRTWTKYESNPVIPNPGIKDFRDPKVIWYEASERWVMVIAARDRVKIYSSHNLKDWQFESDFGMDYGMQALWECPDLFPIKVEETGEEKWVMIVSVQSNAPNGGSGTQYFIGDFDGTTFTSDYPKEKVLWLDWGKDNYAGVTFSDVPEDDGRRILIGWMSNWQYAQEVPTKKWRSAMTLPRTLELKNINGGLKLCSSPVQELEKLRGEGVKIEIGEAILERSVDLVELELAFNNEAEDYIAFVLANDIGERVQFGYDARVNSFFVDRKYAGDNTFSEDFASATHYAERSQEDQKINFHIFIDHSSIELFADDGEMVMTETFFPDEKFDRLMIGTDAELVEGKMYELKSIWTE